MYLYGIVRPGCSTAGWSGIGGAPVRCVEGEGVAALVSEPVGEAISMLRREDLDAHAKVLSAALATGPVLPMRAGVVAEDESDVQTRLLGARGAELRNQLDRFDGRFQANIRAVYEEEALLREAAGADPEILRLRDAVRGLPADAAYPQRIRLGELVSASVERLRQADAGQLLDVLQLVADDIDVAPPRHERVALEAACLIDRRRSQEFDEVLEAFAEAQAGRMRIRYVGPLPPHSFVELAEAA
jgi:hypothetical protein